MNGTADRVTLLLHAIERGDAGTFDELLPLVYEELRWRAGKVIAGQRCNHTLQRTALVHEAYLKLARGQLGFQSRAHFFNAAALAMRRILVSHATSRAALKRGGARRRVTLSDVDVADDSSEAIDWLELDEAEAARSGITSPVSGRNVAFLFRSHRRRDREDAQDQRRDRTPRLGHRTHLAMPRDGEARK